MGVRLVIAGEAKSARLAVKRDSNPALFQFCNRFLVQIGETLEGAFLTFRCWVDLAFRDRHTSITRDLFEVKVSEPASLNLGHKRMAEGVHHAVIRKLQITSERVVEILFATFLDTRRTRRLRCCVVIDLGDEWVYKPAAHLPNLRTGS